MAGINNPDKKTDPHTHATHPGQHHPWKMPSSPLFLKGHIHYRPVYYTWGEKYTVEQVMLLSIILKRTHSPGHAVISKAKINLLILLYCMVYYYFCTLLVQIVYIYFLFILQLSLVFLVIVKVIYMLNYLKRNK